MVHEHKADNEYTKQQYEGGARYYNEDNLFFLKEHIKAIENKKFNAKVVRLSSVAAIK
ncbi:hypothetical protein ACRQ5D_06725 [Mucilaginibacter sp. P25]|uniref:hypothetical protein n=1 Tax=unclassified Mucilaginibacter TaxID=2617802 RepID=UPI003D67EC7F